MKIHGFPFGNNLLTESSATDQMLPVQPGDPLNIVEPCINGCIPARFYQSQARGPKVIQCVTTSFKRRVSAQVLFNLSPDVFLQFIFNSHPLLRFACWTDTISKINVHPFGLSLFISHIQPSQDVYISYIISPCWYNVGPSLTKSRTVGVDITPTSLCNDTYKHSGIANGVYKASFNWGLHIISG